MTAPHWCLLYKLQDFSLLSTFKNNACVFFSGIYCDRNSVAQKWLYGSNLSQNTVLTAHMIFVTHTLQVHVCQVALSLFLCIFSIRSPVKVCRLFHSPNMKTRQRNVGLHTVSNSISLIISSWLLQSTNTMPRQNRTVDKKWVDGWSSEKIRVTTAYLRMLQYFYY